MAGTNPLEDLIGTMAANHIAADFPLPRFALAVLITGNTRDEIDSAVDQLGIDLALDWPERTSIDSISGRASVRLVETSPTQTPELYDEQLTAWGRAHRSGS